MKIDLTGRISLGDAYRVDENEDWGAVFVGGVDLVQMVIDKKFTKPVTVAVMDERYHGDLVSDLGWGYSDWTPVDSDELKVGGHDLIEILSRMDGQAVRIVISDEPVDLMEDN